MHLKAIRIVANKLVQEGHTKAYDKLNTREVINGSRLLRSQLNEGDNKGKKVHAFKVGPNHYRRIKKDVKAAGVRRIGYAVSGYVSKFTDPQTFFESLRKPVTNDQDN